MEIFGVRSEDLVANLPSAVETSQIAEILLAVCAVLLAVVLEDPPPRAIDLVESSDPGSGTIVEVRLQFEIVEAHRGEHVVQVGFHSGLRAESGHRPGIAQPLDAARTAADQESVDFRFGE